MLLTPLLIDSPKCKRVVKPMCFERVKEALACLPWRGRGRVAE